MTVWGFSYRSCLTSIRSRPGWDAWGNEVASDVDLRA
jgi:hypothetical protein